MHNMGMRYVLFRGWYEFRKRTGLLKADFPTTFNHQKGITLTEWKQQAPAFFFESGEKLSSFPISDDAKNQLKEEYNLIKQGKLRFFSSAVYDLGIDYDWMTNPDTDYQYNRNQHWTEIPDFDSKRGDIKYVWEKSRFSFLYTWIRYDKHFGEDQSEFVFSQIENWIDQNPLNCGPNYVCGQETSLRILNWTFALYYYRHSVTLTDDVFQKIIHSIYGQLKHVEKNIHFSRIAVRNNHAITETMMLMLGGILFPFFTDAKKWKKMGLRYFQEEVLYQVYKDGSYIQYSFNYQRVVVQLCTWALVLADKNNVSLHSEVKDRIQRCLYFLLQMQDEKTGQLPNYGANDGALFFPLNSCEYRNYRPQLSALQYYFDRTSPYVRGDWNEDIFWMYGENYPSQRAHQGISSSFTETGYYTLRAENAFTFIRCGNHKDRPSQADNLHIDIWVDGVNILRDAGSYKYNSSPDDMKYFAGTASHNTVQMGDSDQMQKGGRFIWYHWTEAERAAVTESEEFSVFDGAIKAYKHVCADIVHHRKVSQHKTKPYWKVEDKMENTPAVCTQIWNIHPDFDQLGFRIECRAEDGTPIPAERRKAYYSSFYGQKEKSEQIIFKSDNGYFSTHIFKE